MNQPVQISFSEKKRKSLLPKKLNGIQNRGSIKKYAYYDLTYSLFNDTSSRETRVQTAMPIRKHGCFKKSKSLCEFCINFLQIDALLFIFLSVRSIFDTKFSKKYIINL
jgi:hypothetical protein